MGKYNQRPEQSNGPMPKNQSNLLNLVDVCHGLVQEIRTKTSLLQVDGRAIPGCSVTESPAACQLEMVLLGLVDDLRGLSNSYTD